MSKEPESIEDLLLRIDEFMWDRVKYLFISRGATEDEWRAATCNAKSHREFRASLRS